MPVYGEKKREMCILGMRSLDWLSIIITPTEKKRKKFNASSVKERVHKDDREVYISSVSFQGYVQHLKFQLV